MRLNANSFSALRAAASLAALGLGASAVAPAFAQQPQLPPPTFATTRSNAAMSLDQGGQRYLDLGTDAKTTKSFVLETRGSVVLLQQEGSKEILTLMPVPGQRGDTFFMDYTGRTVLKVTKAGNVISYLHNPDGAPADPAGRVPPLSSPAMTASLDAMRVNAVNELSRLAGHDVTIWGTQAFANNEAWAADALSILVLGVKTANGHAGKVASSIDKVTLRKARMYEFMDRLITIAMPRVRDFRGIQGKGFDGRGNFAMGLKEQIVFPEINYDRVDDIRGMDIQFVTTAKTDAEAKALLKAFNLPFAN